MTRVHSGILVLWLLLSIPPARAQLPFPVARAEREFGELQAFVSGLAHAHEKAPEAFIRLVSPRAPLSLSISRASPEEINLLQNMYLGVVGGAFGVDPGAWTEQLHCGPPCISSRRARLVADLPRILKVAADVQSIEGLTLIAHWGIGGEYRINNLFCLMGQTNEARRSPQMGFLPSSEWVPWPSTVAYLEELGLDPTRVLNLIEEIRQLPIVAVQVDDGGVFVVGGGLGDNESGLWLGSLGPERGGSAPNGGTYTHVQRVADGVWYYETS